MTGAVERIYSKALFEIALENSSAETIDGELMSLADIFKSNPELSKFLSVPTVTMQEKLDIVRNIFAGRISDTSMNFICILTENNRTAFISGIAESFRELFNEHNNIAEITVTTSIPLSESLKEKLKVKFEAVYKKSVRMVMKVDENLIGGMVINYGNTMLDGSIKSKLEKMQKQLMGLIA